MFVLNVCEFKIPFPVMFQGRQYTIPFDNQWHEIPDGACEPNGVRGYLRCARTNPIPPIQIPNLIEIDLSTVGIYNPEESNEQKETIQEETSRPESKKQSPTISQENNQETQKTISEIKYGEIKELPDGAVPMEGIKGWLICRPTPTSPILPKMLEIDLNTVPIYNAEKYEVSNEDINKDQADSKENISDTITGREHSVVVVRVGKEDSSTASSEISEDSSTEIKSQDIKESTEVIIQESTEVNSLEDMLTPVTPQEPVKPLKGKHLKNRGIKSRIEKKTPHHSKDSVSADH